MESANNVRDIYSFGFSFSEVDLPYIKKICEIINTYRVTWYFNSYDDTYTINTYIKCLKECGFKGKFSIFDA